jgi:hypothetical protein
VNPTQGYKRPQGEAGDSARQGAAREQVQRNLDAPLKYINTVEAQFKNILFGFLLYCGASVALNLCTVSGEIHQFVRPKMRQYFWRIKSLVF